MLANPPCNKSCSILNNAGSAKSNKIMHLGWHFAICLLSSDPIEPPAPVTKHTFPLVLASICLSNGGIGSLPSKSSTDISSVCVICLPSIKSLKVGTETTLIGNGINKSIISFLLLLVAEGRASTTI